MARYPARVAIFSGRAGHFVTRPVTWSRAR
jgi:hypothetical protein